MRSLQRGLSRKMLRAHRREAAWSAFRSRSNATVRAKSRSMKTK
jgi:hypothetical protein